MVEGVSVPEVDGRTVTPRGESHCDERTDMESGLVRSGAWTAQRRGACEPTGKYWRRVRAATLWNAGARSCGEPEGAGPGSDAGRRTRDTGATWFCSNPACVLHVRVGDPGVCGQGEWAVRPDGVVTSRGIYRGRVLCDVCGRQGD